MVPKHGPLMRDTKTHFKTIMSQPQTLNLTYTSDKEARDLEEIHCEPEQKAMATMSAPPLFRAFVAPSDAAPRWGCIPLIANLLVADS